MEIIDPIKQLIEQLNEAWSEKKYDQLDNLLDDSVIFLSPDLKNSIQGKSSAIKSYQDFMEKAIVSFYKTDQPSINLLKDTAIAVCPFEIKYQISDQMNHETGTEILIFQKKDNHWVLGWRTICNIKTIFA